MRRAGGASRSIVVSYHGLTVTSEVHLHHPSPRRALGALAAILATAIALPVAADAAPLQFTPCGEAEGVVCTTFKVPRDPRDPSSPKLSLHVAKSPAIDRRRRIGSLFINFGGPGAGAAEYFEAYGSDLFPGLNERFDIIAMDPRGTGQSTPSIDCQVNQETQGIYSVPFPNPLDLDVRALLDRTQSYADRCAKLNAQIAPWVSTANVARDMDKLRAALGEKQLTYFGYSYGTFLGATYAALFPKNYRAMVLDGPVDADKYINDPMADLAEQTAGFERALGRFFQACAADQAACRGFGGKDPWAAYDDLVDRMNARPLPAPNARNPQPVTGDHLITATIYDLYSPAYWGEIAQMLADASKGDGSLVRDLADDALGRLDDGTFDPGSDRYFVIGAIEQDYGRYGRNAGTFLRAGDASWGANEHFWSNSGYVELNYSKFRTQGKYVFRGPFRIKPGAVTPLVVATRYDPATPWRGALRLVRDLGNARLLAFRGDGHTAYATGDACIDTKVEAYLERLTLPAPGTRCVQQLPFTAPEEQASALTTTSARRPSERPPHAPIPALRR